MDKVVLSCSHKPALFIKSEQTKLVNKCINLLVINKVGVQKEARVFSSFSVLLKSLKAPLNYTQLDIIIFKWRNLYLNTYKRYRSENDNKFAFDQISECSTLFSSYQYPLPGSI
ncbi:hypothetical protein EV199_3578 [Pseudobacter ginsenosidimutans]|uniref:Uncharacterized protein n=1 Tax=Pseudobacter ginsenosidimutans TaxID=661488 RepID=A0A4Q7MX63_9BACT|nr:hypothetical protein EV199_3578 [Pseudobacter ginsenosidimutans]